MIHELAKKLKDSGFPQKYPAGPFTIYGGQIKDGKTGEDAIYVPTLSELIESINPMKADEFFVSTGAIEAWEAGLSYNGYFDYPAKYKDADGFVSIDLKEEGATPEEAVANLWLALNKSNS